MNYRDLSQLPQVPAVPSFSAALSEFSLNAASSALFRKPYRELGAASRKEVDGILALSLYARRGSPAASGRFPLVIYHAGAGGSFDDNAVLFEYLASHGFVVISSAYQWTTEHVANNIGGEERSIADMAFLIRNGHSAVSIEADNTAAIGHSAGAQFLLQWIGMHGCPLRALVSLDTTLEYTPEDYDGHKPLRDALRRATPPALPVLLFASSARNPNFKTFDALLQRSPRYEAGVDALRHDDYVTHGMIRTLLRGHDAPAPRLSGAIRAGYAEVCRTTLLFLKGYLKNDVGARESLRNGAHGRALRLRYRPPR